MQTDTVIQALEQKVQALISNQPDHFLVEIRIKPTNNIKVFVDSDKGVQLSELVNYNRKLYRQIEESGMFPDGNFSLEVSSPGLDEPLKLNRQYKKNIGRYLDVSMNDGSKKEGKLLEATDDGIVIETEEGKGKKKVVKQESVLFEDIKSAKVQVKF